MLLVFDKDIVIFSVKEIVFNESADPEVAAKRWVREAVEKSVGQLHGAAKELARMTRVIRHNGTDGLELPPAEDRRVHLVAVAAGGKRRVPFAGGAREDKVYVHVMEEEALREILGELDTTPDFLEYLRAKESFTGSILCEGEENLFGVYLHGGRKLPTDLGMLVAADGLWRELKAKPEFAARKGEDAVSYWWDRMIETFIADHGISTEPGTTLSQLESVVRVMASEHRFSRRLLSRSCLEWLQKKQPGSRNIPSDSGVGYVFGTFPREWEREYRQAQMQARCFVARSPSVLGSNTIIGLGTEVFDPAGYSIDATYLHWPEWTEEDEKAAAEACERFGIMQTPSKLLVSMDEFPQVGRQRLSRAEKNRRKRERRERR